MRNLSLKVQLDKPWESSWTKYIFLPVEFVKNEWMNKQINKQIVKTEQ